MNSQSNDAIEDVQIQAVQAFTQRTTVLVVPGGDPGRSVGTGLLFRTQGEVRSS